MKTFIVLQLAVIYSRGHPGMNWIFMEEFVSLIESYSSRNGKLLICGDSNYWADDPAHRPCYSEFMELLNINNIENHLLRPTYASDHTLDLVLLPGDYDVDDLNVLPISSNISDHDMVFFLVNFP